MATHETHNRLLCTRGVTRAEISYALAEINLEMAVSVHHVVNTIMRMRAFRRKMADCTHGRITEGVLDLCNASVSEKTPQILTFVAH